MAWVLIVVVTQCATVTPAMPFSIGAEREVGEKLLYSVRSSFPLLDDPDLTQYVTKLGRMLLGVAGVQYFDYHFFIIDDKEFNAFAAPSGLIFFYSGLISTMNSEDEFISVLSHEVGHIVKRHLASRVETGTYTSIASLGLALAAVAFGGAATPVLLTGALAAGQSVNLHFSRQHEEEADLLAYDWMKKLGKNPEGQARMLETMRRVARYRSDKLPQYLLTHPNPEARLNYIESLLDIDGRGKEENDGSVDDFAFQRFKYRVLSLSKVSESRSLKTHLASTLASETSTDFQKAMAKYGLSQLAKGENDFNRSLDLIDQVITYFPGKTELSVDKGVILFAAGQFDLAETILRQALVIDANNMYAAFTLGQLLYRSKRAEEAANFFTTVSYELPEYAKVYFELGQIAADKGRKGLSRYYLGKYHLYEGKLKLAEENFKSALTDNTLSEREKTESKDLLKKITLLRK